MRGYASGVFYGLRNKIAHGGLSEFDYDLVWRYSDRILSFARELIAHRLLTEFDLGLSFDSPPPTPLNLEPRDVERLKGSKL